jgi:hypothetical protein
VPGVDAAADFDLALGQAELLGIVGRERAAPSLDCLELIHVVDLLLEVVVCRTVI